MKLEGTRSAWASRVIEANGHRPIVVDPNRNRLVSGSTKKTDRSNAASLAAAGRAGLLVKGTWGIGPEQEQSVVPLVETGTPAHQSLFDPGA